MANNRDRSGSPDIRPRFRVYAGEEIALGPGKVRLLKLIQESGSIRKAASRMEMSYMRAWQLVRMMNQVFKQPLVESNRGGAERGGATLTATGEDVLRLYGQLEMESRDATAQTRREIGLLLKKTT